MGQFTLTPEIFGFTWLGVALILFILWVLFGLKKDVDDVKKDYVTCKFCTMQHTNSDTRFDAVESLIKQVISLLEKK